MLRYDARDQGRSTTWPVGEPGYGTSDVGGDVLALLDDEGVDRAHVLGLSGGGLVGQLLALDHPARVATLTLVSSTPGSAGLPGMSDDLRAFFDGGAAEPDWDDRDAVVAYLTELERPFQRGGYDEALQRVIAERTVDRSSDLRAATTNPFLVDPGPSVAATGSARSPRRRSWCTATTTRCSRSRTARRWRARSRTPSCS